VKVSNGYDLNIILNFLCQSKRKRSNFIFIYHSCQNIGRGKESRWNVPMLPGQCFLSSPKTFVCGGWFGSWSYALVLDLLLSLWKALAWQLLPSLLPDWIIRLSCGPKEDNGGEGIITLTVQCKEDFEAGLKVKNQFLARSA
jgi:hypothetical protein